MLPIIFLVKPLMQNSCKSSAAICNSHHIKTVSIKQVHSWDAVHAIKTFRMVIVLPRAAACQLHPKATFLALEPRCFLVCLGIGPRSAHPDSQAISISHKLKVASSIWMPQVLPCLLLLVTNFVEWYRCKHKGQGRSWNFYNWNFLVLSIDAIQATTSDCVRPILASCWQQLCALCSAEHMSQVTAVSALERTKATNERVQQRLQVVLHPQTSSKSN